MMFRKPKEAVSVVLDNGSEKFLNSLSPTEAASFVSLKQQVTELVEKGEVVLDAETPEELCNKMLHRTLVTAPKALSTDAAIKVMKHTDPAHLKLTLADVEHQLRTKTLFPVPDLKTKDNHSVFYMRPSRFNPAQTPVDDVINNLAYVLNSMLETRQNVENGVSFIANMKGWTMQHFSIDYCFQFMYMLQGQTLPVKVNHFIILDPPVWFTKVWVVMKSVLRKDFRRKVKMIKRANLSKYMSPGYEAFLPREVAGGLVPVSEIVEDFIDDRKVKERERARRLMEHGVAKSTYTYSSAPSDTSECDLTHHSETS